MFCFYSFVSNLFGETLIEVRYEVDVLRMDVMSLLSLLWRRLDMYMVELLYHLFLGHSFELALYISQELYLFLPSKPVLLSQCV